MPAWSQNCGWGPVYTGDSVAFSHYVDYTVEIKGDRGYLVDCFVGADAMLEYSHEASDGSQVYRVWGQLGDYQ